MADPTPYEIAKQKYEMVLANLKAIITNTPFSPLASETPIAEIEAKTARVNAAIDKLVDK